MGLLEKIRKKERMEQQVNNYFSMMQLYTPAFTTFEGGLYEMDLTRAAIHSFATHVSKLKPEINGSAAGNRVLERTLQYKPNSLMDTKKYLYRLATGYMAENTAIIVPLFDEYGTVNGFYPAIASKCSVVQSDRGKKYIKYDFGNGTYGAIEIEAAGILTQMQYKNELFGETNRPMMPTIQMIDTQNQGMIEGIKSAATIRFLAKLANVLKPADLQAEQRRLVEQNLTSSNNGGVFVFDQKYESVQSIDSKPYLVTAEQMSQIKENVFNYFGTNEKILRNEFNSDEWNAYYEGKIEPFAIEMSLVHTNMLYSQREIAMGNQVMFTANRLQYLSNSEKLSTVTQLFDRGFITHNQGLEIFNMSPVEDGDQRYIRREYALADNMEGLDDGSGED